MKTNSALGFKLVCTEKAVMNSVVLKMRISV